MRHFSTLLLLLLLTAPLAKAQFDPNRNTADTSVYGYRVNYDPGNYDWIELDPNNGAQVLEDGSLTDDNFYGPINIGFTFPYFWNSYSQLYIGSNGYVMFGNPVNVASQGFGFPEFPNDVGTPNNYIGAYLADLTFTDHDGNPANPGGRPARVMYQTIGQRFIVTFDNVPFWVREQEDPKAWRGSCTFQLILDGSDRSIKFQYKSCEGPASDAYTGQGSMYVTRGFENNTGRNGITFPGNVYPTEEAIVVTYQAADEFTLGDIAVEWLFNDRNQGISVLAGGESFNSPARVTNTGTKPMNGIRVTRTVQGLLTGGTDRPGDFTESVNIAALAPGESQLVEFTNPMRFNDKNVYRVAVASSSTGDQINANNSRVARVVVVDTSSLNANIQPGKPGVPVGFDAYNILAQTGGTIWNAAVEPPIVGGNVGMYLTPPYYPCYVNSLEYGISIYNRFALNPAPASDQLVGFIAEVYEEENGQIGDRLYEFVVNPDDYDYTPLTEQDFLDGFATQLVNHRIALPENIMLTEGKGLFISYSRQAPANPEDVTMDFLVADESANFNNYPSSSRSFEITGGHWAPNRNRETLDFAIRLVITPQPVSRRDKAAPVQIAGVYPNPANQNFDLQYDLKESSSVEVAVYDQLGRVVERRELGHQLYGNHSLSMNTSGYADGIYLIQIKTGTQSTTAKVIVTH